VIAIPIEIILISILWFMVAWVALAMSLNLRDARKRKRLQRTRHQEKAKKTVPVEQVMHLAEWKMEQWMTEREKLN
jgi:predicted Holliday junction resolvase-like endonuclease